MKTLTLLLTALPAASGDVLAHHQQQQEPGPPQWDTGKTWQHRLHWDHEHCGLYVKGKG